MGRNSRKPVARRFWKIQNVIWARRTYLAWIFVLVYYGLVTFLSSLPHPPNPDILIPNIDKIYHFIEYGLLGLVLSFAYRSVPALRISWRAYGCVLATGALLAALDEWHQSFVPPREVSVFDWVADVCGILASIFVYRIVQMRFKKRLVKI